MRSDAGFTLLEILIGLAVLGLLMAGLAQGMQYGFKVWDAQAATIARRDRLDAVDRALRQLIAQTNAREGEGATSFEGETGRVSFTTQLPAALASVSRRADATLLVENHRLILRWTPHLHATRLAGPRTPGETELLSGVEKVEFSYWKPAGAEGAAGGWQTSWSDRQPPELVRIRILFPPGESRRWPDIIAARQREPDRQ
ncbi:prepilin-type N-terminal cleavage/methylation domain-containing protein [Telmatospirillum siberiense]|uniref:Type II secretion system protein J n=1 Tax=Telmatospirillum siberiense TaxID=382514 RepID=A0A2N3PQC1_9PROT|nr:prepilin-type N-terminal cleavage/methylation domain-containing protein [Telmatospirillum siberiense]PKU22603.1 hypothetical protein CWS72_20645 [Telmatospirillum siberiense]